MDKFIFKRYRGGILHVLGSGRYVYYDYDKITAMKPVIDRYLTETEVPPHHLFPGFKPLKAVNS